MIEPEGSQWEREQYSEQQANEIFNTPCKRCNRLSNPEEITNGLCPDCYADLQPTPEIEQT